MSIEYQWKVAICDDEHMDCLEICNLTKEILQEAGIVNSIYRYESSEELLSEIQRKEGQVFHVLLLDVMMEKLDGMSLAAMLRQSQDKTAIIFISNNRDLALYGYEVSAARFLAKPLSREKLKEALLHCYHEWGGKKEILLPTQQGQYRTSFSDIQYVEAYDRGSKFVLSNETVYSRLKFGETVEMMPESTFLLCHRSYIVNCAYIKRIHSREFELKNGTVLPIGRGRYAEVSKRFLQYIAD